MIKKSHPKESYTCEREYDIKDIDTIFVAKYMKLFAEQPRIWEKKKLIEKVREKIRVDISEYQAKRANKKVREILHETYDDRI